jgi:hypothetical protein
MSLKRLFIASVLSQLLLFSHNPAKCSQQIDRSKDKLQINILAKLKPGTFIRVRTTSQDEVRGQFRSFDGSRLVLMEQHFTFGREVTVKTDDIIEIKTGRGLLDAFRHSFKEPIRIVAKPVTDSILAYQMLEAMGSLMY